VAAAAATTTDAKETSDHAYGGDDDHTRCEEDQDCLQSRLGDSYEWQQQQSTKSSETNGQKHLR
jgi:hypothetical protein